MSVSVKGSLRVSAVPMNRLFTDDELVSRNLIVFEQHNLLVNIGLQVFSRIIGGNAGAPTINGSTFGEIADITVVQMLLGNNPAPVTPAVNHTYGVTATIYEPALIVTYPTDYSVRFTGIVPTTEANGETITEEALYLKNGMVFAKRVMTPGVAKTSSFALQFDHEFLFARS